MSGLKNIKKLAVMLVMIFGSYQTSKACSPLNTPVLTASLISGNNLLLNMNSVTIYNGCTYHVDIELVCMGNAMTGNAPFYYVSPNYVKNTTPFPIPQMTVSLAGLCAGGVYQYRWRENESGFAFSPWSAVNSFTMPGVPVPTTLTLNASPPAICFPQTSQLTAQVSGGCGGGGPVSYTWTPATGLSCVNCASPVANPTVTTTYTCIASGIGNTSCWTASNVITVVSFTSPPGIGTMTCPAQLCTGNANTISVSSFSGSIQWQVSANGGPFSNIGAANQMTVVTPTLSPGMYCYHIVAVGCGNTITSNPICTNVNPNPTVSVNSASICQGNFATLNAGGASSYAWSAGAFQTGPATATAAPPGNTAYTVTGTTNGCTATAVANVSVFPYPVVNPTSNGPVCKGNPLNLTTTGAGSYIWIGPNGFTSTQQNPSIPNANPSNSGTYFITVSANGCSTSNSIAVVVLNPTVSASNAGPYCAGQTVNLVANTSPGIQTYNWVGPGFSSGQQNPAIANAQANASGVYTVTVSDGTCSSLSTTTLVVYPLPNSVIQCNSPICEATTLSLSATGGTAYTWTGPLNFLSGSSMPSIPQAPASASGVYTVAVTDQYGCVRNFTVAANIMPLPQIPITNGMSCMYGTASLSAAGGVNYSWTGPNNYNSNSQTIYFTNMTPAQVGDYTVVVTGANSCTNMAVANLTVFPIPQATALATPEVCQGGVISFTGSGGSLYNWYGPNGFVSDQQNPTLQVDNTNYSGTYTLGVIDDKGCTGYNFVNVLVRALPQANIAATANKLCVPFCSQFLLANGASFPNVSWSYDGDGGTAGNTFNYCFNQDGNHTIKSTFTDVYGCTNSNTFLVNVYPLPIADFHPGLGDIIEGEEIDFKDASWGDGINGWIWYFADNKNVAFQQNPRFTFENPGAYPVTLIVNNKWGCKDTVTKAVHVGEGFNLYVPNVFTPNGDGVNDVFMPKGYGFTKYHLQVFDRWGEMIYSSNDLNKCWDGFNKGKLSKEDAYVWKITVIDNKGKQKDFTGHVTLMK